MDARRRPTPESRYARSRVRTLEPTERDLVAELEQQDALREARELIRICYLSAWCVL
jgi:hypothetical protein